MWSSFAAKSEPKTLNNGHFQNSSMKTCCIFYFSASSRRSAAAFLLGNVGPTPTILSDSVSAFSRKKYRRSMKLLKKWIDRLEPSNLAGIQNGGRQCSPHGILYKNKSNTTLHLHTDINPCLGPAECAKRLNKVWLRPLAEHILKQCKSCSQCKPCARTLTFVF